MMVCVEQSMEGVPRETEKLGVNLLQSWFVHHKSYMALPRFESIPLLWEADD
jgi:hypothetical protein